MIEDNPITAAESYCLLIPHYNQADQFLAFLPKLVATGLTCVVVDDGSTALERQQVAAGVADHSSVFLFAHAQNRGKGAAVKTGFVHARSLGFSHAIQIDADGQHNADDIPRFVRHSRHKPHALICGNPVFNDSAPKARIYGRKVTDFWVALETLSTRIKDGLCGFRVYPLNEVEWLLDHYHTGARMTFDTEVLVKAVWDNIDIEFIDTAVVYQEQGVSHFDYLRDNLLLIRLHTRLMLGMLLRSPALLARLAGRLIKRQSAS